MFLPMSCTSPLTVAITIVPFFSCTSSGFFSASMNGIRKATDFFITRADLTTCGRNILPAPTLPPPPQAPPPRAGPVPAAVPPLRQRALASPDRPAPAGGDLGPQLLGVRL